MDPQMSGTGVSRLNLGIDCCTVNFHYMVLSVL